MSDLDYTVHCTGLYLLFCAVLNCSLCIHKVINSVSYYCVSLNGFNRPFIFLNAYLLSLSLSLSLSLCLSLSLSL